MTILDSWWCRRLAGNVSPQLKVPSYGSILSSFGRTNARTMRALNLPEVLEINLYLQWNWQDNWKKRSCPSIFENHFMNSNPFQERSNTEFVHWARKNVACWTYIFILVFVVISKLSIWGKEKASAAQIDNISKPKTVMEEAARTPPSLFYKRRNEGWSS